MTQIKIDKTEETLEDSRLLRIGRWLYKLRVFGEENIPKQGPCIIAFNHSTRYLDSMSIKVVKIHRPDLIAFGAVGMPPSGWMSWIIKRRSKGNEGAGPTMLGASKARGFSAVELFKAYEYLRSSRAVAIAAEGEVPWDGQLIHPLAPGSAWLALRSQAPILPVVTIGGYDILPRWRDYPKLSGRLTVRLGEPFSVDRQVTTQVDDETISSVSQLIYERMASLIAQGHA